MNSSIEKILSISIGVLLITIAFTTFFSSYNQHLDYINQSMEILDEDMIVGISEGKVHSRLTGNEVIHRVIEAKSHQETLELQALYGVGDVIPFESAPKIYIDGKSAEFVELNEIDPAGYYHVYYEADSHGNITKINYGSR